MCVSFMIMYTRLLHRHIVNLYIYIDTNLFTSSIPFKMLLCIKFLLMHYFIFFDFKDILYLPYLNKKYFPFAGEKLALNL